MTEERMKETVGQRIVDGYARVPCISSLFAAAVGLMATMGLAQSGGEQDRGQIEERPDYNFLILESCLPSLDSPFFLG
jgi:hypothetical protein